MDRKPLKIAGKERDAQRRENSWLTYLYDEARKYAQVLTEESNKGTASYTYGRERIAAYQERTLLKYLDDVRGSVAGTIRQENISEEAEMQAESGGQHVLAGYWGKSSYRYTPFGELVCTDGEKVGEGFLYNAEVYDAVSGSYYLRARFYKPTAMRFNQPDVVRGDIREP